MKEEKGGSANIFSLFSCLASLQLPASQMLWGSESPREKEEKKLMGKTCRVEKECVSGGHVEKIGVIMVRRTLRDWLSCWEA